MKSCSEGCSQEKARLCNQSPGVPAAQHLHAASTLPTAKPQLLSGCRLSLFTSTCGVFRLLRKTQHFLQHFVSLHPCFTDPLVGVEGS